MPERVLAIILCSVILGTGFGFSLPESEAAGYTWTDENGVTHFSDEKPARVPAREREEADPTGFSEDAVTSYERRYSEICGSTASLHNASVTLLEIYIERLAALQREIGADSSAAHETRKTLLARLDTCFPSLLSARETAQRRENYQKRSQDVMQQKIQRFDKLKTVVYERLEQRRESSMAKGAEGAKFYSDLRPMADNPLDYGMTEQDVRRLWGDPMRQQNVRTSSGEMHRVSYPLGIDLYFRDGLLETWGWRR